MRSLTEFRRRVSSLAVESELPATSASDPSLMSFLPDLFYLFGDKERADSPQPSRRASSALGQERRRGLTPLEALSAFPTEALRHSPQLESDAVVQRRRPLNMGDQLPCLRLFATLGASSVVEKKRVADGCQGCQGFPVVPPLPRPRSPSSPCRDAAMTWLWHSKIAKSHFYVWSVPCPSSPNSQVSGQPRGRWRPGLGRRVPCHATASAGLLPKDAHESHRTGASPLPPPLARSRRKASN